MDIHPDIRKFWGDRKIWEAHYDGDVYYYVALQASAPIVAIHEDGELFLKYRLDGQNYLEEEMLRLIKLKAFL